MTAEPSGGYRRSWIFRETEVARNVYPVRQYLDLVARGDVVYVWGELPVAPAATGRGKGKEAIVGWGLVERAPEPADDESSTDPTKSAEASTPPGKTASEKTGGEPTRSAELDKVQRLSAPLLRESLLAVPALRGLTILRNPTGTNFRVTATEAARLNAMIREHGESGPPDPEGTDSGAFPPETLSDYRFSGTPTRIFATALQLLAGSGEPRLEAPDLFSLGLELAATYTDRTGISRTLHGLLGDEPLEFVTRLRHLSGIEPVRRHAGPLPWQETGSFSARGVTISAHVLRVVDRARQLAIATTHREQVRFRHFVAALLVDEDSDVQKRIQASGFEAGKLRTTFLESVLGQFQDDPKAWGLVFGVSSTPRPPSPAPPSKVSRATRPKRAAPPAPAGGPPSGAPPAASPGEGLGEAEQDVAEEAEVGAEPPVDAPETVQDVLADLLVPFIADRPEGRDLLGLEDEYRAFAKLIVGTETKLPMAVGLFGHWGTGKSFFMGKLREEIATLAAVPRTQYCHQVAQIEFNAWHYMEADIWASFADHIFRELERKTRECEDEAQKREEQERFENLLDQLETWSALKESSARKLDLARERVKKARAKVDHAHRRAARAERVVAARCEALLGAVKDGSLFAHLSQVFGAASRAFGLKPLEQADATVKQAKQTLAEARDVLAETEGLGSEVKALAERFDAGRAARDRWLPLVAFSAAAVVLGLVLARWNEALAGAASSVTEVLAVVGIAQSWMRERTARAATFVQELKTLRDDLGTRIEEALKKEKTPELARAQLKLERVASQLEGAEKEHAQATSRVTDLEAELAGSTPAERIVQFVRERSSSEAYRGRLGTLALVRRDFERLSDLLEKQARGERMFDRAGDPLRLPEIDRVVLYIDDLDRIPWEKVVKVLQAVHLLLAFPLFVVVVAVDARWVRESVEHHLRSLSRAGERSEDPSPDEDLETVPMRPGEFLEKIIQVPFWLRRLTPETTTALIDGLIEENGNGLAVGAGAGDAGAGDAGAGNGATGEVGDGGGGPPPDPPGTPPADPGEEELDDVAAGDATRREEAERVGEPEDDGSPAEEEVGASSSGLGGELGGAVQAGGGTGSGAAAAAEEVLAPLGVPDIRPAEQDFMKQLAPIVGRTPRVVKRFVNLYLILRAFRPETGSEHFVSSEGEYRAVLLLLAVLTGQAAYARDVFDWFEGGAVVDTLGEWVRGESSPKVVLGQRSEHVQKLLDALVKRGHDDVRMEHVNAWMLHVSRFGFEQPLGLG